MRLARIGLLHIGGNVSVDCLELAGRQGQLLVSRERLLWCHASPECAIRTPQNAADADLSDSFGNPVFLVLPLTQTGHAGNVEVYMRHSRVMLFECLDEHGKSFVRCGIVVPTGTGQM